MDISIGVIFAPLACSPAIHWLTWAESVCAAIHHQPE